MAPTNNIYKNPRLIESFLFLYILITCGIAAAAVRIPATSPITSVIILCFHLAYLLIGKKEYSLHD